MFGGEFTPPGRVHHRFESRYGSLHGRQHSLRQALPLPRVSRFHQHEPGHLIRMATLVDPNRVSAE